MVEYIRIAVVFAAGIYLSERVTPSFAIIFTLSLILVLTIKAVFKHKFGIKILVFSLVFAAGVIICSIHSDSDLHDINVYEGRYVTVTGRISELPDDTDSNIRYVVTVSEVLP